MFDTYGLSFRSFSTGTFLELFRIPGRCLEISLNSQRVLQSRIPVIDGNSINRWLLKFPCWALQVLNYYSPIVRAGSHGVGTSVASSAPGNNISGFRSVL